LPDNTNFSCLWRKAARQVKSGSRRRQIGSCAESLFQKSFLAINPDESRSRIVCWLFLFPLQALTLHDSLMTIE
jgi:hypothetical protein